MAKFTICPLMKVIQQKCVGTPVAAQAGAIPLEQIQLASLAPQFILALYLVQTTAHFDAGRWGHPRHQMPSRLAHFKSLLLVIFVAS